MLLLTKIGHADKRTNEKPVSRDAEDPKEAQAAKVSI
jgi:hypothetical protein